MTSENENKSPDPQGHWAGVPYDWRRPTWQRVKARWWNPDEPRFLTPKSFGWGYDFNLYRLVHPGAKPEKPSEQQ